MDIGIEKGDLRKKFSLSRGIILVLRTVFVFLIIMVLLVVRVELKYRDKIVSASEISGQNIGLVFGAGLKKGNQPSDILEDRIVTAIGLYQDGKIGKIIMSGDNQGDNHDEVTAMKNFALAQGLPEDAILTDNAGINSYSSCANIKKVFSINKIVLITQKYHLSRTLYLCNELGIDAIGVPARDRGYVHQLKYSLREIPANLSAWFTINIADKLN